MQFQKLLPAIAKLMHRLALPGEQLARIETNLGEMAESFPALLPGFPKREEGWMEIRRERPSADGGFEPFTSHSERWGSRRYFRIFARVPNPVGGSEWFHTPIRAHVRLPENSVVLLAASPLVITSEGELMASRLITLAEVREVKTDVLPGVPLPFAVLEGTRAGLVAKPRHTAGLHQLAPETPIPMGATCVPDLSVRVPLTSSCESCHGDRAKLGGAFAADDERIALEEDPRAAAEVVIARKRAQPAFERLRQRAW